METITQEKPTCQHLLVIALCAASSSEHWQWKCSLHIHQQLTSFLLFSFVPNLVQHRQFEPSKLVLALLILFAAALRLMEKKISLGF